MESGIERLRARGKSNCASDVDEFARSLKRRREQCTRDSPTPAPPSEAADAASKRQLVAAPSSTVQLPGDAASALAPPFELEVEGPDGNVHSCIVEPSRPLRDTLLCLELPPGEQLRLDGAPLDTGKSVRDLGLAHRTVLQAFRPQTGGGYEELEAAMHVDFEAERDLETTGRETPTAISVPPAAAAAAAAGASSSPVPLRPRARKAKRTAVSDSDSDGEGLSSLSLPRDVEQCDERDSEERDGAHSQRRERDESPQGDDSSSDSSGRPNYSSSDSEESEDESQPPVQPPPPQQQPQQPQQPQRAQATSDRAARFQREQQQRVRAPTIADAGIDPCGGMQVEYAPIDASKVPDFGTELRTTIRTLGATLGATRSGQATGLEPTIKNTLVVEAGCSAEKTRKLVKWLKERLVRDSSMPFLFVTTRQTHADDLAAMLKKEGIADVVNYRDSRQSDADTQKEFLARATRVIVSFEGLDSVDLELYRNGVVVMDEVRSLAAIPGGGTMEGVGKPSKTVPCVNALRMLCQRAKYRLAMDADISADGAVRDFLQTVAPGFDVLHVQLRKAALSRKLHYGFTESKRDTCIMNERQRLALFKARESRKAATERPEWEQLRVAALAVIKSWVRAVRKSDECDDELALPFRDHQAKTRDAPPSWKPVSIGMVRRQDGVAEGDRLRSLRQLFQIGVASMAMRAARKRVDPLIERVFVIAAQRRQAGDVADMANEIGAFTPCDDDFYSGKGDDATKRAHFKDTTRAWFWADVVIATSTLSVGVNVRVHFACCFLYTSAGPKAPPLRVLLQGIVRVGRDANDPLMDECIFALIHGKAPTLDSELTPQPARHNRVLVERRKAAAEGRKAASAAKAAGDARLDPPVQSAAAEEPLSDPLQRVLAWNELEMADNQGPQHAIKLAELCKLPTRAWPMLLMRKLPEDELDKLDEFERDLTNNPALARLKTEDARVGRMSSTEKYEWMLAELEKEATKKGTTLDFQRGAFIADEEGLYVSTGARPEKDARAHACEELHGVLRHLTPFDYSYAAWPEPGDFASVSSKIGALVLRATLQNVPRAELEILWEAQRRQGRAAHSESGVVPPHRMHELLTRFAEELRVPFEQLLEPITFVPAQHEWLKRHNRLRAKIGDSLQQQRDKEWQQRLCDIARKMGVNVTKQMLPVKIVARVLRDVLALVTPEAPKGAGEGERKVAVDAAHGKYFQVVDPWVVKDDLAAYVSEIQLDMLDPESRKPRRVRAADWVDTFERLTNQVVREDEDAMLTDAEEEDEGGAGIENGGSAGGAGGAGGSGTQRTLDPLHKSFQVDRSRLRAVIDECDALAPQIAAAKAEVDARCHWLRNELQGDAGDHKSAFVLLVHPEEPSVLMAREERRGQWAASNNNMVALNPLGGKRKNNETGRETAAREAREETAEKLSKAAGRGIKNDAPGVWDDPTKSYIYVHRSTMGSDAGLHEKWSKVHATPTLQGVEWVPIDSLLDDAWRHQHCHDWCLGMIAAASELLQEEAAQAPGSAGPSSGGAGQPLAADEVKARRRELKGLDALHTPLARFGTFHSVARGFDARCERGSARADDGWVELRDTYKQTVGRRYVDANGLPRVESEGGRGMGAPPRTATLQGGHSDLRTACCGAKAFDIDCENGDFRLSCSLSTQTGNESLVPTFFDYVAHRATYVREICELHDACSESVAKRLPNVVSNGGSYQTWLRDNSLREPNHGSAAFQGKKCKAFLPPKQCASIEPNITRELNALRTALFQHSRFRAAVEVERGRLERENLKPQWQHDATLWSTCVVQASENEVLGIIERALSTIGWDVWALIFDGLMAAPSPGACTEPDVKKAMQVAEDKCKALGWDIKLADKPLHGLQEETPKSITKAREALELW